MKFVIVAIAVMVMLVGKQGTVQSDDDLIGKWATDYEMDGEEFNLFYEFKLVTGQLVCYAHNVKSTRHETKTVLVMDRIVFLNGGGTANYMIDYDDERDKVEAALEMPNPDRLHVSYSYDGFGEDEVWTRVK